MPLPTTQAPNRVKFTAGRVATHTCPPDKAESYLWDTDARTLGLKRKGQGEPVYVFQSRLDGRSIRLTIGKPDEWTIPQARAKAREWQRLVDDGQDPRQVRAAEKAAKEAEQAAEAAAAVTVGEAWQAYCEARAPLWSDWSKRDHEAVAQAGGIPRRNRPGVMTTPGPLASIMPMRLKDLTAARVEALAKKEAATRATRTRLALRLLKGFLNWCAEDDRYRHVVDATAGQSKKAREAAGRPGVKDDCLERGQLFAWFSAVQAIPNPVIGAYLQILLLTGARREELALLKWEDISFHWSALHIRDKVEGERPIPLTDYVAHLISALPRRNEWVFSSPQSASGRLVEPTIAHRKACDVAGLELTPHGLRRSFGSLAEWLEIPAGVVAQIMGHKPSAIAEKHYRRRPLDLLRVHHQKLEDWILAEAGIVFDRQAEPGKLRLVEAIA